MGNTFEVNIWVRNAHDKYDNQCVYRGESFLAALWSMFSYRKATGCLKLEWRPRNQ